MDPSKNVTECYCSSTSHLASPGRFLLVLLARSLALSIMFKPKLSQGDATLLDEWFSNVTYTTLRAAFGAQDILCD
jgi:hypothetical protein